ncbi:hypothetical protein BSKO_06288 [Bryopsis sp. KO-2023]|nr:hypothetical protein BSKO_06288 [Bryopsis sp. KO-2023]
MGRDGHRDKKRKKRSRHRRERSPSTSSSEDEARKRRRTEKLSKKIQKHLKKYQESVPGYNNEDNIFNDPNLNERFVWKKKIERQLDDGVSLEQLGAKAERIRQDQRLKDIEKAKKLREEREAEQARQQEELSMIERARYAAEATEAAEKEEEFLLSQAMLSSRMRLQSGRGEPIDFIVRNLDAELAVESMAILEPPDAVFKRLNLEEMQKLIKGIDEFRSLDKDEFNAEFWNGMKEVATHELMVATQEDEMDRAKLKGEAQPHGLKEQDLHVNIEVQNMLAGKSFTELCDFEKGLNAKVESGNCGDPEFMERVLDHLKIYKVRARLRALQETLMERHMDTLRKAMQAAEEKVDEQADEQPEVDMEDSLQAEENEAGTSTAAAPPSQGLDPSTHVNPGEPQPWLVEELMAQKELSDGRFSPEPLDDSDMSGETIVDEEHDLRELEYLRAQVRDKYTDHFQSAADTAVALASQMSASDKAYQAMVLDPARHPSGVHPMLRHITDAAPHGDDPLAFRSGIAPPVEDDVMVQRLRAEALRKMGCGDGDMPFGGEVKLESRVYWWHEKYRPRKPKYFNRVHTGYEWNKYNQTHYDHDNPPPKVVQGYKFNIFYPDLMDKKEPPTYSVEMDNSSKDGSTCLLRFKAGPPYEDIAFRIVNKDWEYSHKKGFKCTFERGILHLYFNFKRQRYRR